jgi:RimJ/RimL family protein N-acetyltransferase
MTSADAIDWTFAMGRVRGQLIDTSDRALYLGLYTSPDVMAYIGPAMTAAAAAATFERALSHSYDPAARARYWRIVDADSGEAAGIAALVRRTQPAAHGELGIMLLPHWQNRGLGLSAVAGIAEGVIAQRWWREVDVLVLRHAVANSAAAYLPVALGFEGRPDDGSGFAEWWLDRSIWRSRRDAWPAM